ncbi:glycosyltransferase [Proteiniphilum sp.]|uniref:glycosyltransferase n=1 Tax=Proteiniphilum sp. TaxID=1926877 RepID=UPI002B1F9ED8|nr:glycosyltransferase [Proteiniphilum sp.]MEA4915958.1 glycosyltransferase [Proteiniphilum sp.]
MDQSKPINKPKVSVIIPVYNTEAYVEEAIRSVMNQTLRDIEIIIIDDGSTDHSLSVIKKLAREDDRIQYFSQINQGQSVARNAGIKKATGEYIYFMDSDDFLEENAFESCYSRCTSENLDFVFFDAVNFGEINKLILEYNRKNQLDTKVYTGIEILNLLLDIRGYRVPPWLHFINLSFLQEKNIFFDPNLKKYEDQIFSVKLYLSAHRVAYIPASLFHRRLRHASLMTNLYSLHNVKTYFKVTDELVKLGKNKSKKELRTIDRVIKEMLNASIYMANKLIFRERLIIGTRAFKNYRRYISPKTWIVLFFPLSIKIKSSLTK